MKNICVNNHEHLCWNCLQSKENIHYIDIPMLGYGSQFDEFGTHIQLCDDCYSLTNPEWWNLETVIREGCFEEFKYEKEIINYVKSMPLAGQELFWNSCSGECRKMEPQDWIDYELGILPYDVCEKYGMYSPEERLYYLYRFPKCVNVFNVLENGKITTSACPYGVYGLANGECDGNYYSECYKCNKFIKRPTLLSYPEIQNIDFENVIKSCRDNI